MGIPTEFSQTLCSMNPEIVHTYTPHFAFFRRMHVFAVSHDIV